MRKVINLVLVLITGVLAYWLYASVREPIAFAAEKDKRKEAVVTVLKKLQITQDVYRMVTGKYAGNFDSLSNVIKTGKVEIVKLESDPSDPTNQDKFIKTVSYKDAKDTLYSLLGGMVNVDSLRYVPYGDGAMFTIAADTMTYQNTLVNVLEVATKWDVFMGDFKDPKYKKYDALYDPSKTIKFGDMNTPNTNGNW